MAPRLRTSLPRSQLQELVTKQVNNLIPDDAPHEIDRLDIEESLERFEYCVSRIHRKYFHENNIPVFNHLHGDQYSMFLYMLSNSMYRKGKPLGAAKVFLLNKQLFGIDVFYAIELPKVFYFSHPLGTVLGNAKYGNYLVIYQGVTIGSKLDSNGKAGTYPSIGECCALYANTTIIGDCSIGKNVTFGAGSLIINENIDSNTLVLGTHPNNNILANKRNNQQYFFGHPT